MENDELDLEDLENITAGSRSGTIRFEEYAKEKAAEKRIPFSEVQDYISSLKPQELEDVDATLRKIDDFIKSRTQGRDENEASRD